MCPTKMLLKLFVDSNTQKMSACLLFIIILKEQWNFSKTSCDHGPLGCYCLGPYEEITFWCHYLKSNKMIWCNLLVTPDEVWNVRALINDKVFSTLLTNLSKVFYCLNRNLTIEKLKTKESSVFIETAFIQHLLWVSPSQELWCNNISNINSIIFPYCARAAVVKITSK